ncbi:MAG: FAD-binding protein, partial [Bacteroidetes bacterium]
IVVNGMSPSSRNSKFANSGMVVEIRPEDAIEYKQYGKLALLKYQENLEKMAFLNGGTGQTAPAQRLHDFVNNRLSASLPETSYHPGIASSPLHFWLPEQIGSRLQQGFKQFGKKMYGYLTNEAVVLGVESRTSSPVRIPRDKEKLHHPQITNLFPCGEGAGFAGGIVSSAVDGELCAEQASFLIKK